MIIIDTPWRTTNKAPCLASSGVTTVIRYYNFQNSSSLPEKRLELPEAEALSANRIQIAVVFQARQTKAVDFTETNGLAAGRRAYRYAHDDIGQPEGSGIYFAVDFDASNGEVRDNVIPYFEGVKKAFSEESVGTASYRVGAYGSGFVCSALAKKKLIDLTWLAMSRGFRGTKDALEAGDYDLAQRFPPAIVCGLSVDHNDANPSRSDFGAFTLDVDGILIPPTTTGIPHRVIARSGLRLRGGPGLEFSIVGSLSSGQIVHVTPTSASWGRIDIEGDGQADGFAHLDFLERV